MRPFRLLAILGTAGLGLAVTPAQAGVTVSLHGANAGIGAVSFAVAGNTITIDQTWTSTGPGILLIDGLKRRQDYRLVFNVTNATGQSWASFASELLDPAGQRNDREDATPQPGFVPAGWSTSNDNDKLRFAAARDIARGMTGFAGIVTDQRADQRDWISFVQGSLLSGGAAVASFGVRDRDKRSPFLLVHLPTVAGPQAVPAPVPEPGTLALLGAGLAGLGLLRRGRRRLAG